MNNTAWKLEALKKIAEQKMPVRANYTQSDILKGASLYVLSKSANHDEMLRNNHVLVDAMSKDAGFWDSVSSGLGSVVGGIGAGIHGAKGYVTGLFDEGSAWENAKREAREAYDTGKGATKALLTEGDIWSDAGENIVSGAKSMGNGLAAGAAAVPGGAAALGAGIGSFGKNLVAGKGLAGSFAQAVQTGAEAKDWVDSATGLGRVKDTIARNQRDNLMEYQKRNGIDPNNMSWLDRGAMFGQSLASEAGEGLGMIAGTGALGGVARGVKAVSTPIKTMKALGRAPGSTLANAVKAFRAPRIVRDAGGKFGQLATAYGTMSGAKDKMNTAAEMLKFHKGLNPARLAQSTGNGRSLAGGPANIGGASQAISTSRSAVPVGEQLYRV